MVTGYVLFLVVSQMSVSSTMLILNNKFFALLSPVATTVILLQVGSSTLILWILGKAKVLTVKQFQLETVSSSATILFFFFSSSNRLASS
jgi:hypothetical protein